MYDFSANILLKYLYIEIKKGIIIEAKSLVSFTFFKPTV